MIVSDLQHTWSQKLTENELLAKFPSIEVEPQALLELLSDALKSSSQFELESQNLTVKVVLSMGPLKLRYQFDLKPTHSTFIKDEIINPIARAAFFYGNQFKYIEEEVRKRDEEISRLIGKLNVFEDCRSRIPAYCRQKIDLQASLGKMVPQSIQFDLDLEQVQSEDFGSIQSEDQLQSLDLPNLSQSQKESEEKSKELEKELEKRKELELRLQEERKDKKKKKKKLL